MTDARSALRGASDVLARTTTGGGNRSLVARGRPAVGARARRAPVAPRSVALFGLFGCGNSGNDGSLEAMLIFLRQVLPGVDVVCISPAANQIAIEHGLAPIPVGCARPANRVLRTIDCLLLGGPHKLTSLIRAVWHARKFDVLMVPGTGILDDFGERPSGVPAVLFGWCLAARLCRAKIAFVSIGAGPIDHPLSRWLMKSAVGMASYRSYRDSVSKAFMESIGFETRGDPVYPDLAFKLPAPPPTCGHREGGPPTVGVGVMTYFGWRNDDTDGAPIYAAYLEKITDFVLWLLDRGHPVRILMGDAGDRRAVMDLITNVTRARPALPQDRLRAEAMTSLHELMRQIAETDVVVATRFHNVVCALKLGKPTVSIGYADKNDALMAEMGLDRFCQHINRLNLDQLIKQFTQLVAGRYDYERGIRQTNLVYSERLEQQDSLLASRLFCAARRT